MKMLHQDTNLLNFPQKLHEIKKNFVAVAGGGVGGGGGAPGAPPWIRHCWRI